MLPDITTVLGALVALVAVLAMIGAAARLARSSGLAYRLPKGGPTLAVEEAITLDARRRLLLVRCRQGQVLLLTGGTQDLVVGWLQPDKSAS